MSFSFFFVLVLECIITISKLYFNRTTIHVNGRKRIKTFLWQPWARERLPTKG